MNKPLRRLLAGLTLTAAATTIGLTATHQTAGPATVTQADTAWGTPPVIDPGTLPAVGDLINPYDTAWG